MPDHTAAPCIRCRELVDINQSAIAICVFSHTVGIDQALQSPQARVYVCSMCADAMVKGDEPPKTQPLKESLVRNSHDHGHRAEEKYCGSRPQTARCWLAIR